MTRIIANNEAGVIADIAAALAERNIDIETISAEALGEKGAITPTADDQDGALRMPTDTGFKTVSDEALILTLQDEPDTLAGLAERFNQDGVSIWSLHILDRRNGYATVAISVDARAKAEALVEPETALQEAGDGAQAVEQCRRPDRPPPSAVCDQTRRDHAEAS